MLSASEAVDLVYAAFLSDVPEASVFVGAETAEDCVRRMELTAVPDLIDYLRKGAADERARMVEWDENLDEGFFSKSNAADTLLTAFYALHPEQTLATMIEEADAEWLSFCILGIGEKVSEEIAPPNLGAFLDCALEHTQYFDGLDYSQLAEMIGSVETGKRARVERLRQVLPDDFDGLRSHLDRYLAELQD